MCLVALPLHGAPKFTPEKGRDCCTRWESAHFAKGRQLPFSFIYDGKSSDKLLPGWKYSITAVAPERAGESIMSHTWTDPKSGLQVECKVKSFTDFNAMEWVLYLRNTSSSNTGVISKLRTLDWMQGGADGDWHVLAACGPHFGREDFRTRDTVLSVRDTMMLSPFGGRSSSHTMPYFNVISPSGGVIYAIGWTGNWIAEMERTSSDGMAVKAGLKYMDAYLLPGEELRMPSVVMIPWQGDDRMDGQNILRRFILAHHHPYAEGKPVDVPVCNNFDNSAPSPCDEFVCMTDYLAKADVRQRQLYGTLADVFWMDAGWFGKAADWDNGYWWHNAVGNWFADPVRYPEGMAPVADMVHDAGCRFMLWYEPERAHRSSAWAFAHPEYMLSYDGGKVVPVASSEDEDDKSFLLDYGNPEALDFVIDSILTSLMEYKVDVYRQDFNIDPQPFWAANDKPGRTGMCEVRYINGLYRFLDTISERIPHLVIDNCAGGGRRLDIEMLSRSVSMWRSDYSISTEGKQNHSYDLYQWIPVACCNTGSGNPYEYRSALGAGICFAFGIHNSRRLSMTRQRELIDKARDLKRFYLKDYYPLTGYGDNYGDDCWLAYQLNDPDAGEGMVVAFRRPECSQSELTVHLRGLDPEAEYSIHYDESAEQDCVMTGKEMSAGFKLVASKPARSVLFEYSRR